MIKLRKWNQARKELLADPKTAKEFEDLRPQYEVISSIEANQEKVAYSDDVIEFSNRLLKQNKEAYEALAK